MARCGCHRASVVGVEEALCLVTPWRDVGDPDLGAISCQARMLDGATLQVRVYNAAGVLTNHGFCVSLWRLVS